MAWLLMAVCCAIFVELFSRVGVLGRSREVDRLLRKAVRVMASRRISDHWKESVLPRYARSMFASSVLMFASLIVALSPFAAAAVIADRIGAPFLELLASFEGIVGACVFAIAYARLRTHTRPTRPA